MWVSMGHQHHKLSNLFQWNISLKQILYMVLVVQHRLGSWAMSTYTHKHLTPSMKFRMKADEVPNDLSPKQSVQKQGHSFHVHVSLSTSSPTHIWTPNLVIIVPADGLALRVLGHLQAQRWLQGRYVYFNVSWPLMILTDSSPMRQHFFE